MGIGGKFLVILVAILIVFVSIQPLEQEYEQVLDFLQSKKTKVVNKINNYRRARLDLNTKIAEPEKPRPFDFEPDEYEEKEEIHIITEDDRKALNDFIDGL